MIIQTVLHKKGTGEKRNKYSNHYSNTHLIMDIQTAKQIRIADFLYSLGYSPVKQQGINLWYKSPLRKETEPSFKINTERNQWYDFDAPI